MKTDTRDNSTIPEKPGGSGRARNRQGPATDWVVLKFGGTSVSSLERWQTIEATVRDRLAAGHRVLLVCSALSQVSNRLERLLAGAGEGEDPAAGLGELRRVHADLADETGLDVDLLIGDLLEELASLLQGVKLTEEVTPRTQARVLAAGELMSTRLGEAWLSRRGVPAAWYDARELLVADADPHAQARPERQYLSATCEHGYDPELVARLDGERVVVTQGFIARLPSGEGVLLGRGGSDTAAAYLAGKLGARHLEIWTDVPGMFTANPRQVAEARLLERLGYGEAGELAAKGAKVLHPRSIRATQEEAIPVHVHSTPRPELPGTVISARRTDARPQVKAVSARKGIVLVSMDVEGDWQPVGVIADIAGRFKAHGLSIDLLASSQTNMAVALDPEANLLDGETLELLLADLAELCEPRLVRPAASVSLVGSGIREILHEWAPALQCLEDVDVHLVAQAANDLSLTFVVGEAEADWLVETLHRELFAEVPPGGPFGPTWESLCGAPATVG